MVSPIYHNADDREWSGFQDVVRQSAMEASVVLIDDSDNDDDAGGVAPTRARMPRTATP
jgi:hypothetical protein